MYRMPTEWEQDVAEEYVNYRQITRPATNVKTAVCSALLFTLSTVILVWLAHFIFINVGIISYLPDVISEFYDKHPVLSVFLLIIIVLAVETFFCLKYALIGVIKLYQHYAPLEIRRRCLFKPTCSEYGILAIKKYGGIIGGFKTYYRLVYLCKGNIYKIDYPWSKNQ